MEESLLLSPKQREEEIIRSSTNSSLTWRVLFEEVKKLGSIAAPLVAVLLSQFLLQVISVMMVGHLGELSLSSTALAISLSSVTGFSIILGMASALETICGQAFGAQQYKKLGIQTYTAIFSLSLVCIPISVIWIYMEKLLVLIGQDPLISHESGKFIVWLIPALFAYATLQALLRYFQTQSLIIPMLISSCLTLCFHIPLSWVLVFKSGLGNLGGALAISISFWLNAIFLVLYMKFSPACAKTRAPISMELFHGIREFFRFAIPSAIMTCLEWWSFELLILMSGLLPNPQLETSVLSVWEYWEMGIDITNKYKRPVNDVIAHLQILPTSLFLLIEMSLFLFALNSLNTIATLYSIPYGVGAAGSTRISNELGAGNAQAARIATFALVFLTIIETSIISTALFASRRVFGYTFSNEKEVVDYVTDMAPLLCISVILDSIQGVLTGVARGCGWQHIGAFINLGAFYLGGIPMAATLGFFVKMRGKGLWIGIQFGAFLQTLLLSLVTSCTNWEKQASKARERIFEYRSLRNGLE